MYVTEFTADDRQRWDEFVVHCGNSLPFHLFGWQSVMDQCYHFPFWYLVAMEGNRIEGVLPLIKISSKLVGTSVRSLPGGICSQNPLAVDALLASAKEIALETKADYLIIQDSRCSWEGNGEWHTDCSFALRELPTNCTNLRKGLKRQVQQHIHKAETCGVSTCVGIECVDEFYAAYCDLMHEKGVPVFSRSFLDAIVNEFEDRSVIVTAYLDNRVIGAIFLFLLRDTVFAIWGGAHSRYWEVGASFALWWEVMKYAVDNNYCYLDMGRSLSGSGTELFKSRWGCHTQPVYDMCLSLRKRPLLHSAAERYDGYKYQIFTKTWQLLPETLVEFLGPRLRRHIPFG